MESYPGVDVEPWMDVSGVWEQCEVLGFLVGLDDWTLKTSELTLPGKKKLSVFSLALGSFRKFKWKSSAIFLSRSVILF